MQGLMDFPDDLTTNVFRVDDIKEIHWAFYSRKLNHDSALQNPPSSEEEDDLAQWLQSWEHILREKGLHVLLDEGKAGVWVFSMSQAVDEGAIQTSGLDGLECISVGSIHSGDLTALMTSNLPTPATIKTARSAPSTVTATEELNAQAYSTNVSANAQSSTSERSHKAGRAPQNHLVSDIYSNLTLAVSRSLSHALGKRRGWLQTGPTGCIDVRTLGDDPFNNSELQSSIATTRKISFDVKWLSSGTMLITFLETRMPRLQRISNMLSRTTRPLGLAIGWPLLLSPFGIRCHYMGIEGSKKNNFQRKSAAQTKASILSRLSYQGLKPMQEVVWIHVQTEPGSNVSVNAPVSLWPADFCLSLDLKAPVSGEDGELSNTPLPDSSADPLEKAESWFLGKSARVEALRARELEENQKAQALKDAEDTDDEDVLSPFEVSVDQGITPQDVSGIYPTPPDGLPPALLASSNPNNVRSGDYDDEEKALQPNEDTRGDGDGQANDDLFGDMDIDMFASNGLTEADFSFFDEPGMIDENLGETGQVMALDDANETGDQPRTLDGQAITSTPNNRGDSGSDSNVEENKGDVNEVQGSSGMLMDTNRNLPTNVPDNTPGPVVGTKNVDYHALKRLNLRHGSTFEDVNRGQRGSFEHVSFQTSAMNFDEKYSMQGRFAFDVDELPISKSGDRHSLIESHLGTARVPTEESSVEDSVDTGEEDEDATAFEDSDSHEGMNLALSSHAETSPKRKRERLDENDHIATPSSSVPQVESPAGSARNKSDVLTSDSSKPDTLEQLKDTAGHERRSHGTAGPPFIGRGYALINAAQLIAHQAVAGLLHSKTELSKEINLAGQNFLDRPIQKTMAHLVKTYFPTNKRCNLKDYASLGEKNPASGSREQVVVNSRNVKPTHVVGGLNSTGRSVFKLDSPFTRVRRNGVSTDIAASALSFWEELSLGPAHEPKDIDAFCVCPQSKCIEEGAIGFLSMIKGAYQSCNLGIHDLGPSLTDYSERIVTVPINAKEPDKFLQDIAAICEGFGTKLSELGLQKGTTVIYIINPFKDQRYLPGLCDALSRLPNSYGMAREKWRREKQDDVVMQIIPLDLVWSSEFMVVPSPAEYRSLAFEIYNQCASSQGGQHLELDFISAPAICLAKAIPKTIDFRLASESSAPLMQSDNCVHVSYAWDTASEWLVAIWTDNLGILSWRACYCLGRNAEKPWKPFYEVAKEIFETSFDMLRPPNAPWRLFVCKDGLMYKPEKEVWLRALADSSRPSILCAIITVDANPHVTFTYADLPTSFSDIVPALLVTPGATPQTNTPSPDISGPSSTPAGNAAQVGTPPPNAAFGDHDSEAKLIDITDETWGILMDGILDDPFHLSNICASLASGYLVKRAGPRDENGLIPLGVNLLHGQKPYRGTLKEVLGMYRNLGTLARVRGVVDPMKSVLPLHVAAARKAWKAVSETMRHGHA